MQGSRTPVDALALILHRNSNLAFHLTVCSCTSSLKQNCTRVLERCIEICEIRKDFQPANNEIINRSGAALRNGSWNEGIKPNSRSAMIHSLEGPTVDSACSHWDP